MNGRDDFYAQYAYHKQDWRDTTAGYFLGLALATVAFFLAYCGLVDPTTTPKEHLFDVLAFGIRMASRASAAIFRLQGGAGSGREGGALKTVFGLDSGSLRNISPTGTAQALRGLGTLLKGAPSDLPPGLGNMSNSCYQNSIIQVRTKSSS
jgi:ubiquitin carboxyl-terminal hydrolase 1